MLIAPRVRRGGWECRVHGENKFIQILFGIIKGRGCLGDRGIDRIVSVQIFENEF
jgi:hypothetical protein